MLIAMVSSPPGTWARWALILRSMCHGWSVCVHGNGGPYSSRSTRQLMRALDAALVGFELLEILQIAALAVANDVGKSRAAASA